MPSTLSHPVEPGGLSDTDRETIHQLGAKGWNARRIGRRLSKHPSTVQWYMYCVGLKAPQSKQDVKPHIRNGFVVRPFSAVEDRFILEHRVAGLNFAQIATKATEQFGHERKARSVRFRLIMLASQEGDA